MTLLNILIGTFLAGVGSVLIAAMLATALLSRLTQQLLSLAAGALLATAFMHLLPEAFESGTSPHRLFLTLLIGVVFFFLLDKAELWHHGHEHSHHGSYEHHHHHNDEKMSGSWAVLLGDSIHAFGDGILVAAAFLVDTTLGVAASVAILAHEVPHHIGDLIVLQQSTQQPQKALIKLSMAGGVTVLGGLCGYALIDGHQSLLPYLLTVASSSYIYVALADLIPQLQKRLSMSATLAQIIWLFAGIALVTISTSIFNN
ncbi:MAG: ZIP family metal transporter [Betaproteobacteria bacterium]